MSDQSAKRQKTRSREECHADAQAQLKLWFGQQECERVALKMLQHSRSLWVLPSMLPALWPAAELALRRLSAYIATLPSKEQIARALDPTSSLVFVMQAMPTEQGAGPRKLLGDFVEKMLTLGGDVMPPLSFAEDHATLSCVVASLQFTVQTALLYGRAERWSTLGGHYPATRCFMNYLLRDLTQRVVAREYAASALMMQVIEELARVLGRDVVTS
mgnify:CR=1 FL=1